MARAVPCSAESLPLAAEQGCTSRESEEIQDEIVQPCRGGGCPSPTDIEETCFCFEPFSITSWFKPRCFLYKSTAEIAVSDSPSTPYNSELRGCPWNGRMDLRTWTELLLAAFGGLLPHTRISYLSRDGSGHKYSSVTGAKTQASKPRHSPLVCSVLASLLPGRGGWWLLLGGHTEEWQGGSPRSPARRREGAPRPAKPSGNRLALQRGSADTGRCHHSPG